MPRDQQKDRDTRLLKLSGRLSCGLFAVLVGFAAAPVDAAYPDHTLTAIVPFSPGGAADALSRIVATDMSGEIGQNIVIENKTGGGGNLGIALVAHAKPDGYTLLMSGGGTAQNPAIYQHLAYDPKDLMGIAMQGIAPQAIVISAARMPAKTLSEAIDLIRNNPGKYNMATGGGNRMLIARFLLQFGLNMEIVPYKGGADATTALLNGETDMQIADPATLPSLAGNDRIRILATMGEQRLPMLPNIPTTKEAGFPGYTEFSFAGLWGPVGLPADEVAKLHDAATHALSNPELVKRFASFGYVPEPMTQQDFDSFYRNEVMKWREVAQKAHIPPAD